jgi:ATP-dependent 26S proteasome regulatory subunit
MATSGRSDDADLGQVEAVRLEDLHGMDEVVRKLEANIILPLENDGLAKRLDLSPRRGVLLYGPPGTGRPAAEKAHARFSQQARGMPRGFWQQFIGD